MWGRFFQIIIVPLLASNLYYHLQSQSLVLLCSCGSVLRTCTVSGLRLFGPQSRPIHTAVGSSVELLGVYQTFLPHVVAIIQQSMYNNMTVNLINRVSLDSSCCVVRCILFGRDGASVKFMWQQYVFLEHWTKWKTRGISGCQTKSGTCAVTFLKLLLYDLVAPQEFF